MMDPTTGSDPTQGATRRIAVIAAVGAALLLVPYVGMQVSDEVNWTATDFAVAAAMLALAGTALELGLRRSLSLAYRGGMGLFVLACLAMVWISLAVGIVGEPGDVADLLYLGVIAVAFTGGLIARFKAGGMVLAMVAGAAACVVAGGVAAVAGFSHNLAQVAGINGMFAVIFLAAAGLFWRAAHAR